VDNAFKYTGSENRHRLLGESPQLVRWLDWTGQTQSDGIEWADELATVRPSWPYGDFEGLRTGGTQYDLYHLWDDPESPTYQALEQAFERIKEKADPVAEPNRSPTFPTSGRTYTVEIIATGPFWSIDLAGFESLKLDRLTAVFPVIWRHDWSLGEAPDPSVPRCVSQWAKIPYQCCL
jgi:hypothetical protein